MQKITPCHKLLSEANGQGPNLSGLGDLRINSSQSSSLLLKYTWYEATQIDCLNDLLANFHSEIHH